MPSQRFRTLFDRNISAFAGLFSEDADSLFLDERNKLIHPGEYGRYREDSCKNMLRLLLDNNFAVSDGFLFSSKNNISTQCDIIVYNSIVSPIVADNIARMFPVEEVRMVGEVKSKLDRTQFIEALRKISQNKKIVLNERVGPTTNRKFDVKTYDTIATFLICRKLDFDYKSLKYSEVYGDIDRKYWHNGILSIEDGYFGYALDFNDASEKVQDCLRKNRYNIDQIADWSYSSYSFLGEHIPTRDNHNYATSSDKYRHIIGFFVDMINCIKDVWTYEYDPIVYLGFNTQPFFSEYPSESECP